MSRVMAVGKKSDCQRWNLPELGDSGIGCSVQEMAGGLEKIQQQAYKEGFERGLIDGQDAGRQAMLEQVRRLEQLMSTLTRPFEDLDQSVERELLALVIAIVRQLVGSEISTNPEWIMTLVREVMSVLPSASRNLQLFLHPEDARMVNELSPASDGEKQWHIIEDVSVGRGGCRVATDTSRVDASLDARLNNIVASLVDAECSEDAPE